MSFMKSCAKGAFAVSEQVLLSAPLWKSAEMDSIMRLVAYDLFYTSGFILFYLQC